MTASAPQSPPSSNGGTLFFCFLLVAAVTVGLAVAGRTARQSAPESAKVLAAVPESIKPVHSSNTPGLANVYRLGDSLYSGSSPDEDGAFETLARWGIKTIVSVDGAPPDLEKAREFEMRYVHLPMTYSSLPKETLVSLVRASRELPGPIYIHCHHGQHRGPAAAVALWKCLDKHATADQAVAAMKVIGTADRYQGLYDSVRSLEPPVPAELNAAKSILPESTHVPPLAKTMAEIDRMWDRVATPSKDRSSTTLSMQLNTAYDVAEQFREAARLSDVPAEMQPGFDAIVADVEKLAEHIRIEVRDLAKTSPDRGEIVAQIKRRCDDCHDKFRN